MLDPAELTALRTQLRRLVEAKAPRAQRQAWDKAHTWPRDVFADIAALGVCGLTIGEEHGGLGQDLVAAVAVIEELARAGSFLCGPYIHCAFYGGMNISENGSPAQKAAFLPRLAKGELMFAYGLSEPDVGGDLASVTTRARRDGDSIVINGAKRWCSGADWADYIYCLVQSDAEAGRYKNLSFVLIPKDTPGVRIQPIEHVNLRYMASCDVFFDDVRLPLDCIVGGDAQWNQGWRMLSGRALDVEKLEISAAAFGIAQAAVEEAWTYAGERRQFGKPISAHQAVRHALVDARTKLEACRHMLYHAAQLASSGAPCAVETSMAKLFIGETVADIALICQRVLGAYALSDAYDMERHVRDLLGMAIVGGSSNMQRNNLASLLRLPS
jgi:alkylation response protein AidB-like acyl-CoA dehydrogenase